MREDGRMPVSLRTPSGRQLAVIGDESALTMDRWNLIRDRLDSDPRIVSCSVVSGTESGTSWSRGTAPAGITTVVAIDAADLVGPAPSEPDEVDAWLHWCARASDRGLWHDYLRLADVDVAAAQPWIPENTDVLDESNDATSASHRHSEMRASRGLTITVDATWLGAHETGAQVLTTHALTALAQRSDVTSIRLTNVTELPAYAQHLADLERIDIVEEPAMSDVVWYPNQIDARVDLSLARELGRRVVITYLDLIAYDIPRYHGTTADWLAYRRQQRTAALLVDGITTISQDVADRLLMEVPLLDPTRVRAIPLGVDHVRAAEQESAVPAAITPLHERLTSRPFIVVLGNDFAHKNRDFAIRVWQQLLDQGVACDLVLAGLHVRRSSSKKAEQESLATHVDLRGQVHTLGHVDQATKTWLLANAAAVHYPSSAEGFGFVPYEAAALQTPTSFTRFGPLRELLDTPDAPRSWRIEEHAADLAALLTDLDARQQRIHQIAAAAERLTWANFAEQLTHFFIEIADRSPVPASALPMNAPITDSTITTRVRHKSRAVAKKLLGRDS